MALPSIQEIEKRNPLPPNYRWRYESSLFHTNLARIKIQKKSHFLGLFYWSQVDWTVLRVIEGMSSDTKWRLNLLWTELGFG